MVRPRPAADKGRRGPRTPPRRRLVGRPLDCRLADFLAQPRAEPLVLPAFRRFRAIVVRPCRLRRADGSGRAGAIRCHRPALSAGTGAVPPRLPACSPDGAPFDVGRPAPARVRGNRLEVGNIEVPQHGEDGQGQRQGEARPRRRRWDQDQQQRLRPVRGRREAVESRVDTPARTPIFCSDCSPVASRRPGRRRVNEQREPS